MSPAYDWARFRTLVGRERQAIPRYIDPDEEPTVKTQIPKDEELEAELRQHAGAGQ